MEYALVIDKNSNFFSRVGEVINKSKKFGMNIVTLKIKVLVNIDSSNEIFYHEIKFPEYYLIYSDNFEKLESKSKVYQTFI